MESDVIGITTDGAKVMVKMAFVHQLCIAHGLHLAVMDVLYSREAIAMIPLGELDDDEEGDEDARRGDAILDAEEEDEEEEEDDGDFQLRNEDLDTELPLNEKYQLKTLVSKVRNVVNLFHSLSKKFEALDAQTLADHGRTLGPIGDCKTRRSIAFNMIARFLLIRVEHIHQIQSSAKLKLQL